MVTDGSLSDMSWITCSRGFKYNPPQVRVPESVPTVSTGHLLSRCSTTRCAWQHPRRNWGDKPNSFLLILSVVVIISCVTVLSTVSLVQAWDKEGHQAVGMTATSALRSTTHSQLKRLLSGKDVGDVGSWAHRVGQKYPETNELHFLFQKRNGSCESLEISESNCPQNKCLVRALQHFYLRLVGRPDIIPLMYPAKLKLTESDALLFLVNLIGDLHQPCHLGFHEDKGGQSISILYTPAIKDSASRSTQQRQSTSLFKYWDSDLINKIIQERPSYWYGGWTQAQHLGTPILTELRNQWEQQPADQKHQLFETWAFETLVKFTCKQIYWNHRTNELISNGFEANRTFEYLAFDLIQRQILIAGFRLSLVLDTIMEIKDSTRLRKGSGIVEISVEDSPSERTFLNMKTEYLRGFTINMLILVVILSIILYVKRYYSVSVPISPPPPIRTRDVSSQYGRVPGKQVGKRS